MSDTSAIIYGIFFFAVAGATFAFMWKMTTASLESINKPIPRRNIHPEMADVKSGEELLVFDANRDDDDDDDDVIIIRK